MQDAWGESWPWHVCVLTADGTVKTLWRCATREQATRECELLRDHLMAGTVDNVLAAWVAIGPGGE